MSLPGWTTPALPPRTSGSDTRHERLEIASVFICITRGLRRGGLTPFCDCAHARNAEDVVYAAVAAGLLVLPRGRMKKYNVFESRERKN